MKSEQRSKIVSRRAGYALPAVLTIVTILTLIYMVCILALQNLRSETVAAVQAAELERTALTAEARFAFLASTEPLGANALQVGGVRVRAEELLTGTPAAAVGAPQVVTPLKLDDRPYLWREATGATDSYLASAQDAAGLVNLDRIDAAAMLRLLRLLGVSDEAAEKIANAFDAYRRAAVLSSQERASGPVRPIAPNGLMRRYAEIYGVPGLLATLTPEQRRRLIALTSLQPDTSTININTASADVLQTWYGMSAEDAAQIVARRTSEIFSSPQQIGIATAEFGAYTFPSGRFRFTLASPKGHNAYSAFIVLTPGSFERPFWVEDARILPLTRPAARTDELQPFPTSPDLVPAS